MSRQYDDWYHSLPTPVRHRWYEEPIDYEEDNAEWRPIPGYPDYFVSRYGEVLSMRKENKFTILKTWPNQYGHQMIRLQNSAGKKCFLVHRLVAEAFLPNLEALPVVMHKDDDPTNNDIMNLKWGTQRDNMQDCFDKERNFVKPIYCFEKHKEYKSCAEAASEFGVSRSLITMCCEGKIHSIQGGYHLCFLEDKEDRQDDINWLNKNGNYKPVKAISVISDDVLYFKSRKDASLYLDILDCSISNSIHGRIPYTKGWMFQNCSYEEGEGKWINP